MGERYLKTYNGLVQIEVNHLANAVEVEQVKRQAALLPQTFCRHFAEAADEA